MSTYYAILTAVGEAKLANATALGTVLQLSKMAVGDGSGTLPTPVRTQTALLRETYRADLNTLSIDPLNPSQIIAELVIPETEGGYWLREMGIYDAAGDLFAVANCPPSYKPQMSEGSGRTQVLRMVLIVSSTAAVQLKIDPSVVLATRDFVTTTVTAALAGARGTSNPLMDGVAHPGGANRFSREDHRHPVDTTRAPLDSPAFTGTPKAPTLPLTVNNDQLATTAFVLAAVAALVDSSPESLNTLKELAAALGNDANFATTVTNALSRKLDKAIPVVANLDNASVGPFAAATATAINSPIGGQGTLYGFTYLDPLVSASKIQVAINVATQATYVRAYYGTEWSPWAEQVSTGSPRVAKAWANFRGTGTVSVRKGLNISSITDGGTGDYGVNFAAPMPDANYAAIVSGSYDDGPITGVNCVKAYGRTVNGFRIGTTTSTTGRTAFLWVDFSVFTN